MKPSTARSAAAIIATAGLALLTAACGGSPSATGSGGSSNTGGSARIQSAVAFSRCMRSHGVPNFPDPSSSTEIPKETAQQLGVSSSQLQSGLKACQHLLPNTGNSDDNPVALHRWWSQMRHFALCMHAHGVPNWPDPSAYSQDPLRPTFNLHAAGIGFHLGAQPGNIVNSPQIQAKVRQCESVVHLDVSGWYQ
jgi:hypothetical protein